MRRALALARHGLGRASPNPMVGAVLVEGERVVGEGWHGGPGTPHAEAVALAEAGGHTHRATLYVTLEPCSHFGRTPPCADAIRNAGVARVVAAVRDPNPAVDGRGFETLRAAGVVVEEGLLAEEGERLIAGFTKHISSGLPLVTLKMAASLDGKVAARDGSSRWITGEAAREDAHRLRAESDAIVVGAGTALADDPALTVRLRDYRGRPPLRVIVDAAGRLGTSGKLFDSTAPTLVATTAAAPARVRAEWEAAGAEVQLFDTGASAAGPAAVPMDLLVAALGKRDVLTVLVEGGPTIAWAAIDCGVVDRFVLYLAPKLIGGTQALGILGGVGIDTITGALPLTIRTVELVGQDLRVEAHVHRDH